MNAEQKKPLLSVAVITYNQEQYIAQTLDSILSQEHEYPYEIVVGEDCSSDGTRKIVEDYASRYPDIIKPHLAGYVAVYRVMSQSESHCVSPEKQKLFDDSCRDIRAFYTEMFDAHKLYDVYVADEAFQKAWDEKDRTAVISNGCVLLR